MFDESFFVAAAFFTVIGAFIYLKLPSKLMQSLDEKSAQIAKELDDAKALRAEAEKVLADYEEQRKQAEAQAEQMIADAKASAESTAAEARAAMQAAMEAPTIDPAKIEQIRAEQMKVADESSRRFTKALVDAGNVLDASQRQAFFKAWGQHHGKRG